MKVPFRIRSGHTGLEPQLTPLIDCVFLLLVYFLWTSGFAASELSLPSKMVPQVSGAVGQRGILSAEQDFDPILITVRQHGREVSWTVQDASIASLAELRLSLKNIARIKPDIPVIVDPASDVPLGDVLKVFDNARLSGLS